MAAHQAPATEAGEDADRRHARRGHLAHRATCWPSEAAAEADDMSPTPPARATAPRKRRFRLDDLIRGIYCRARSNVHLSIGRTVVKAWSAGAAFDAPLKTGEEDNDGVAVAPLTTKSDNAKWSLRGRRYLMTVRGRKEFVEGYRAFKNNFGRTDGTSGSVRV